MNELFTVDYALNYEGWTLDPTANPLYNKYLLDQFIIKVRRNDFYLMLNVTNGCGEVVFYGRIYTIYEYKVKVKRHLTKWKCRPSTNNNPSPNTQPPIGIPQVINLTYNAFQAISPTNILEIFNEESTLLSITTIPDIILTTTVGLPQYLTIGGTAPALGNYTNILTFRGDTSGIIFTITLNITCLPVGSYIVLEDSDFMLQEDNYLILIE